MKLFSKMNSTRERTFDEINQEVNALISQYFPEHEYYPGNPALYDVDDDHEDISMDSDYSYHENEDMGYITPLTDDSDSDDDEITLGDSDEESEFDDDDLTEYSDTDAVHRAEKIFDTFKSGTFDFNSFSNYVRYTTSEVEFRVFTDKFYNSVDQFYGKVLTPQQVRFINWLWIYKCKKCMHWNWNDSSLDLRIGGNVKCCPHCKESRRKKKVLSKAKHVECSKIDTCAVCMDDFQIGTVVSKLPCSHSFHKDCIVPWLTNHAENCPCCRTDVPDTRLKHPMKRNRAMI